MAIQSTKKHSDLEKRLTLLRRQVYGVKSVSVSHTPISSKTTKTDQVFLYQDLLKIGIFASVAIGLQIILFILNKQSILNLNLI